MPALLCPRQPANRETVATEMVQSVEQQQPQSFAESAPLANDSSPQRGVFRLLRLGNPMAQHLTQLGASEDSNNYAQSANLLENNPCKA